MEKLRLPAEVEPARKKLDSAFQTPVLGEWPEDEKVLTADQPEAVAGALVGVTHQHLVNASIAFLFQKGMKRRDHTTLAKASKASSKVKFLTAHDFIITVNWEAWRDLRPEQRIALMDHELAHCDRDPDTGAYTIRHHDVEEFSEIVRRWGLWQPELVSFGRAVKQLDLFAVDVIDAPDPRGLRDIADREAEEAEREVVTT